MLLYPRAKVANASMKIIAHGNSLTAGVGASGSSAYWPAQAQGMAPLLGSGITIVNAGVGGQSIATLGTAPSTMIGTAPAAVDAALDAAKLNVLIAWEGINEITQNGFSAAGCITAYQTYFAARRAAAVSAGAKLFIIVTTSPPARSATLTDPEMIARNEAFKVLNTALRTNHRKLGADLCCDLAAYAPFSTIFAGADYSVGAFSTTTVYNRSDAQPNDYIHFGDSGYLLTARIKSTAIRRVRKL